VRPSAKTLRVLATDLGISVPETHLVKAAEAHARLRPALEALRQVRLPYLDSIEPPMVEGWVRSGGRETFDTKVWPS
jgi:hypothetical protein